MLKLEIVNAERPEGMKSIMVSTRIPLSKEAKGVTDDDLSEVIPYILSTHRLYNGKTLNCIVRRVISFNPLAVDSLLVVIEAETGILRKDKEKIKFYIPNGHTTKHKPHAFFLPCFSIYALLFLLHI